ncbi:unnamed protein product [Peniophora sp. CBMAI 1063]|nr:unnamed protein product [Peniophora sp. CBMAI 1063]
MTAISLLLVQARASTLSYSTTAAQHITDASPAAVAALFFGATLVTYLCFKRFEPGHESPFSLGALLFLIPSLLTAVLRLRFFSYMSAVALAYSVHYTLIIAYTVIYRLSPFHPLAQYPGPILPRISKWYSTYVCKTGHLHLWYQQLHNQYGDIVRVGPNELSIRDATAIPAVLDAGGLPKGPFWDNRSNPVVLVGERDVEVHAHRRRTWARGLTASATKEYVPFIEKRARQLMERLGDAIVASGEKSGEVNLSAWLSYFATDFMGDMAFGGGFELMKEGGDTQGVWDSFENGLQAVTPYAHASWSIPFIQRIPGLTNPSQIMKMRAFGKNQTLQRLKSGARRKDLFYHLSDEEHSMKVPPSLPTMIADGLLAIIAGSDTTSTVLTSVVYFLLRHPEARQRLQAEIAENFLPDEEPTDSMRLSRMPWLNACINEAMRLLPPVPSGSQRTVPRGSGSRIIGSSVIPEQTQVQVHTWSIHRDPRNFASPDAFLPTRWLRDPVSSAGSPALSPHNPAAFFPFSHGAANCAGKHLAMLELRVVITWLFQRFDVEFAAQGIEGDRWEESLKDNYIFHKGKMWVKIRPRCH